MSEDAAGQTINVDDQTGNSSFTMPNTVGDTPAPSDKPSLELMDIIPESYKEKPWLKKYTNIDDFFKGMDGAQELLGKRPAGIPQDTASKEEWDEFYTQLGRPKTPEEYKIEYPSELPEGITFNEEQQTQFTNLAHEMGLTQKQVEQLTAFDLERRKQELSNHSVDTEALDNEFNEFSKKAFGDREKEALDNAKNLLTKHAPKEMHEHLQNLDNKALIALTSVLDAVTQEYLKEDTLPAAGDPASPQTTQALHKEKTDLLMSEAYRNPFHIEHDRTKQRLAEIYQRLEKLDPS